MHITSNNRSILYKPVRNEISEVFFYDEVLTVENCWRNLGRSATGMEDNLQLLMNLKNVF